jgi:hypothetical protein
VTDLQHEIVPDHAPREHHPQSTLTWWLAGSLVLALLAVVGLGAWVYSDHHQATAAPVTATGVAPPAIAAVLASRVAAVNSGDKQTLTKIYGPTAVVEERDQNPAVIYSGNERIATILNGYHMMGFSLHETGVAVKQGQFVAEPLEWSSGGGIAVYEFNDQGVIIHQWVIGESVP